MSTNGPEQQPYVTRLSRRELLRAAALGGPGLLGAYLLACKSGSSGPTATATPLRIVTPSSAPMRWHKLAPSGAQPLARYDHSLVTDGTHVYLFGGRRPDALADFWTYDIAGNTWTEVTGFGPQPRFGHNAIWDSGRSLLVLFGGQDQTKFYDDVWEFDPAQSLWTQVTFAGSAPAARSGAGAAFDQAGHLFITHGYTSQDSFDTWQYDLAARSWTEVSPANTRPVKRSFMRGVWDSLKQRLIILGGQTDSTPFLDDLWAWSPVTEWQELARNPRPPARSRYSMVFQDQGAQIILFGGDTEQGPVNDLWAFHSSGENWTKIPADGEPPQPRYGHDAVLVSQAPSLVIYGGYDGTQVFDDLWSLAPGA
jgi:N-acetylneuraminic acid mutarotase